MVARLSSAVHGPLKWAPDLDQLVLSGQVLCVMERCVRTMHLNLSRSGRAAESLPATNASVVEHTDLWVLTHSNYHILREQKAHVSAIRVWSKGT